jgi:hypothetical protein
MGLFQYFNRSHVLKLDQANRDPDQEITELRSKIESLEADNARQKVLGRELAVMEAQQRAEQIISELSQSVVYTVTQISIIDSGSEVSAIDLVTTARMTLDSVRRIGAEIVGMPEEAAPYDPELHESSLQNLLSGTLVEIKIPGLKAPSGRVVRKAVVEVK